MNHQSNHLKRGRKFDQVLEGARQVFMASGFEGASVDEIARVADVSKATLYSYFPDKRLLFQEVVQTECDRMAEQVMNVIEDDLPVREILERTARRLVAFVLSDFAQQMFRICVAERDRFPELGHAFYQSGPQAGHDRLCAFLRCAVARGELVIEDIDMAADQFAELCKTRLWVRALFGVQTTYSPEEMETVVQEAIETFLCRYGGAGV
jgi:AcrR family transcriptional regulator